MGMYHFQFDDAPKNVRLKRGDMRRIWGYLLPAWRPSLLIVLCILASAVLGVIPPLLVREVIDRAIPSHDGALLNWLIVGMIGAPVLAGLVGVWQSYLATVMGQDVMFGIRNDMFDRVLRQSMRFFTNTKSGEIVSRLQNDVGSVQGVITGTMVSLVSNTLIVITTLIVILRMDWRLSLVATAVLPFFILPTRGVGRLRGRIAKETQERTAEITAAIQETLSVSGYMMARLFGAQEHERRRFRERSAAVRDLQIRQSMAGRWFLMFIMLFASVGPALIYWMGGHEAIAGRISIGTIVAFVGYLGRLYAPATALVNAQVDVMSAGAVFRRIFDYLDLPIEIAEPAHPARLAAPRGALRFEDVSMAYGGSGPPWTVADLTFDVAPGQMVALVGPSGAGKTTVTYLATRLYDPTRGRVTFDGLDLRDVALDDLARWTAKVTQETTLFHATIAENLRYAKRDASDDELERACRLAQVWDVVAALPQRLDTLVGERGYKLSGGERQRLALARVVLRDPRLLILDEATSSLDSHSETLIRQALEALLVGRSSLVIAHRLSTILRADVILAMDHGRIVERGSHAELLAAGGLYARLYDEQFATAEAEAR
ncbi:MAG TPA: ABC transporter ATP-binding protein [Candidatus Saccharimonadaceae bacterium]|jgi:ATP-binding cassette subfamily B protein|nr:ABC transporter ATP-binding protein [Candidatus Saccharimonadaceae bacterium]